VHRLLGIKPIYNLTRYEWIAFFYLTFWTTCFVFANSFGKSFQSLFANRYQLEVCNLDANFENIPIEEIAYHKIPIGKQTFVKTQ
jgi:hypothetical protein